ncbi:unnamed protein product [Cuscuta campestris]|uniref:feruloyl-CoA 6-hydroxylase n=1 Tax=Cuscuta campestris TaxID=132261 RepID=A0A484LF41_9ASTE|nr:unnamed protein product [Cuscuta campestris]
MEMDYSGWIIQLMWLVILITRAIFLILSNSKPHRARVIESLQSACKNFGFFQLVNHGISEDVISNMRDATRRFFNLPVTEREKYMSSDVSAPVRYGTSFNQTKDVVFCWRDFLKLVCDPHVLPQWPSSPFDFRKHVLTYAEEVKLLYVKVVEAILESLGVQEDDGKKDNELTLKELKNGSQFIVVNYYPQCPSPDLTLGIPPHSDIDFLTLLLQDHVNGLQIHHRGDWVGVDSISGAFVVNVGDLLEIFSNEKYKSVMHRALVNSLQPRFSVASFHSVPFETTVRPLPKPISESNPKKYKDTDFATFLEYYKSCDSKNKNFIESRKICLSNQKQDQQGDKAQ